MSLLTQTFPPLPKRPSYHTGMLLDAEDFQTEQGYHRGQLARLARWLHGLGTVTGLEVKRFAAGDQGHAEETIEVRPGLALDRVGRLIEVRRPWCLRLSRWFAHTVTMQPTLEALHVTADDTRFLLADVFLRFLEAPQGLRPGFPEAAADATDAVVASTIEDAFELSLVARSAVGDAEPKTPVNEPKPADRAAMLQQLFALYEPPPEDLSQLGLLPEHPAGFDPTALFLARIRIRLKDHPATELTRDDSLEVAVDNSLRRIAHPAMLLFA